MLKGLVLAAVGFFAFLILHVVLFRVCLPKARFFAMVRVAVLLGGGLSIVYWVTPKDLGVLPMSLTGAGWLIDWLNMLVVFAFLFVGYSMFYFLVDRGFSGRIMIEIVKDPARRLRPQDIATRYSMEMVLRRRVGEMVDIGRLTLRDGRYCNTGKGQAAVKLFALAKRFLQLGEGG